jgi:hypothetical protein
MIKIKYVGAKTNGERAFQELTGLEWFPGDENEVKPEHAGLMLRHPDVFAKIGDAPVTLAAATPPASGNPVSDEEVDEEATRNAAADKAEKATLAVDPAAEAKPVAKAPAAASKKTASKKAAKK